MLWHSGGEADTINNTLPKTTKPLVKPKEERIIVILDLCGKLALDLDTNPAFQRGLGPQFRVKQAMDFLIVGSSNDSPLTRPLNEM
jgi:hypothetical protein